MISFDGIFSNVSKQPRDGTSMRGEKVQAVQAL